MGEIRSDCYWVDENVLKLLVVVTAFIHEYIKPTELYTLNGCIVQYINYISIKLLFYFKAAKVKRLVTSGGKKDGIRILVRNNTNCENIGAISLRYRKTKTVNLLFRTQKMIFQK